MIMGDDDVLRGDINHKTCLVLPAEGYKTREVINAHSSDFSNDLQREFQRAPWQKNKWRCEVR